MKVNLKKLSVADCFEIIILIAAEYCGFSLSWRIGIYLMTKIFWTILKK
jgi:hypothetical protein